MLHYCRYDFCGRLKQKEKSLKNGGFYAVEYRPAFFGDFFVWKKHIAIREDFRSSVFGCRRK